MKLEIFLFIGSLFIGLCNSQGNRAPPKNAIDRTKVPGLECLTRSRRMRLGGHSCPIIPGKVAPEIEKHFELLTNIIKRADKIVKDYVQLKVPYCELNFNYVYKKSDYDHHFQGEPLTKRLNRFFTNRVCRNFNNLGRYMEKLG
jgi:hypothetical protein